jgi:hypothetical protein
MSYALGGEYLFEDYDLTVRGEMYYADNNFNWYTQAAYSLDAWTPYVSYAQKNNTGNNANSNHSVTTGLRFDITPMISLNLEYQRVMMRDYKEPSLTNPSPTNGQFLEWFSDPNNRDANVYTLMVNFII